MSRNNGIQNDFNPNSLTYKEKNTENNIFMLLKTKKVLMNNLIWENIKSTAKFPIKLNLETNNFPDNFNNDSYNKNSSNRNNHTYYGHSYKRNLPNLRKRSNNISYKNSSFSYDNSYHNMQIEYQNNLCYLSSTNKLKPKLKINNNSSSIKKENNSYSKNEQKTVNSIQNLKKNETLLKMKLKKLISPEEIQKMRINRRMNYLMDRNKYNKIKEEKFETYRNHYYKNTIMNRINFFYGKIEK